MTTPRPLIPLLILASICAVSSAQPRKARQEYRSPDGKLVATVIEVNGVREFRVEIRASKGKLLLTEDFSSDDMDHGQVICKAAWTPDGEFFVFSMESSGGHSVMSRPTLFYSRKQNRLFNLEDTVGFITEPDFKLEAPDWIITEVDNVRHVRVALSTVRK